MKIWIYEFYGIFLDFIFIFQVIFGFTSLLKSTKKFILFAQDLQSWRGAARTRDSPTRTEASAYVAQRVTGLAFDGPTG